MKKRGQVTTFMIVGLVLIFVVGAAYLVNEFVLKSSLERDATRIITVPEKIKPIKENLDSCLNYLTIQALKLAGSQGGYISLPTDNLPVNPRVPFSNTFEISPGSKVPFWFYETSNGIQKSQVLTLNEIQEQISNYLYDNFNICVEGLNNYIDQGYVFTINNKPATDILINDEITISKVTLPITIDISGLTFNLNDYPIIASVKSSFGRMYKIAKDIQTEEDSTNFFEEKTFDAMIAFSDIPVSGTEFSCTKKFWEKNKVINSMKSIISNNMNAIRLKGNYEEKNPLNEYFDLTVNTNTNNINTLFLYSREWPMVVDISPSEGNVLKGDELMQHVSDQVSGIMTSLLCINNWNFIYDIKYPLLISLVDTNAFDGQGLIFQFADLVIIKNNQPKRNILGTYNQPEFNLPICKYPSTNVTVYTFSPNENGDLDPLTGVDISYKCFTTKCQIGITEGDEYSESSITTQFPQCLNGAVIGEKNGYYQAKQIVSTNEPVTVYLTLEKLKTVGVNVKLIEKSNGDIRDPYESESVIFELKNKDNDFSTSFVYPGTDKIDLIPGIYDVKSYIIANSTWPITIQGNTIQKCVEIPTNTIWGIVTKERKCSEIKIEDMVVNDVVKGGAEFEWDLQRNLLNKDQIIFYTMADNIPGNFESLNLIYSSISQNANSRYFKEPE